MINFDKHCDICSLFKTAKCRFPEAAKTLPMYNWCLQFKKKEKNEKLEKGLL